MGNQRAGSPPLQAHAGAVDEASLLTVKPGMAPAGRTQTSSDSLGNAQNFYFLKHILL